MREDDMTILASLHVSLPLLGIGAFILILSICFCCYMCRLRQQGQVHEDFETVTFASVKKKMQTDVCAVCLEEFKPNDKVAFCHCHHGFHKLCLTTWLRHRSICPMCKARVHLDPNEHTGLVAAGPIAMHV